MEIKKSMHRGIRIALFMACSTLLFLPTGCARKARPCVVFLPVEIKEQAVHVNQSRYPDEITVFFCAENFDLQNAVLTEIVGERNEEINFLASRIVSDSLEVVIFVEDCSGSMRAYFRKADEMISATSRIFIGTKIGLIRVGRNAIWSQMPIDAEKFQLIDIKTLPYPKPNGTSLSDGIKLALDWIGYERAAIVIITDGNIEHDKQLCETARAAKRKNVPFIVMQMDDDDSEILSNLAFGTDGFFASRRKNALDEIFLGGWKVKYSPAVMDTDGAVHHIILRWGAQKRLASYTAPGKPSKKPAEYSHKAPIIPTELIAGIRIPFMQTNNALILPATQMVIDSVITLLVCASQFLQNPTLRIDGYTCDLGEREYNVKLSIRRAEATAKYLQEHCPFPIDFQIFGHGEDDPLLPNINEENRRANRRTEIRLIQSDNIAN